VKRTFTIGTRGSRLALAQTAIVRHALLAASPGASIAVRQMKTEGDASPAPLSVIGGTGVFTKAIEDALLRGEIDIAVHSLKDLPPRIPRGLAIAAVPARADPRDALVTRDGRTLASMPANARVGTGSARRAAQLRSLRPDIEPAEIRGNVDTRVRKVESGEYDGAVLALAGLQRLGLEAKATQIFTVEEMLPAVGQACLAVEVRRDDAEADELVRIIDDEDAHRAAAAERAFLARLGAGCNLPVGAFATVTGGALVIHGMLATGEPPRIHRASESGRADEADEIGALLAETLIMRAGERILAG
jgi:hydroxymethylbilane synthase